MKLYFAGGESGQTYNDLRVKCGVTRYLCSFYHIGNTTPMNNYDLLVDSGGFTARTKGTPIDVRDYAAWLNKWQIKTAFNLDTNDVDETLRHQAYLEKNTSTYIIPIYHLSDFLDRRELLDDFLRYPYISIGGVVGETAGREFKDTFYKYTFSKTRDKIKVHGLGITSEKDLRNYPFYSVDSTSWLSAGRFGNSSFLKDKRLLNYRNKNRHFTERAADEIKHWLAVEKRITELWGTRGITWIDG